MVLVSESRPLAVSGTREWPQEWSEATERQKESSRLRVFPARVATGGTVSGVQGSPFLPFLSQSFLGFETFHLQSLLQFSMDVRAGKKWFLKRSKEAVPGRREEKWPERERKLWLRVLAKHRPGASIPVAGVARAI